MLLIWYFLWDRFDFHGGLLKRKQKLSNNNNSDIYCNNVLLKMCRKSELDFKHSPCTREHDSSEFSYDWKSAAYAYFYLSIGIPLVNGPNGHVKNVRTITSVNFGSRANNDFRIVFIRKSGVFLYTDHTSANKAYNHGVRGAFLNFLAI